MTKSVFASTQWEIKKSKLAVCVPTRDTMHSAHALCLVELIKFNTMNNIDTHVFMDASTILLTQRTKLAQMAIDFNSEYILWLDSDMTFPATTAVRLLSHKEPIVAANYAKRSVPCKSVAYKKIGDWNSSLDFNIESSLVPVEGIGMGCMLMKTKIFEKLPKPWFEFTWDDTQNNFLGEDMNLCKKISSLGYQVKVDTVLSTEIRHLGSYAFGPKDLNKI